MQQTAVELIAAERARQIAEEGWTPEHDDGHMHGELADAAACYAATRRIYGAVLPDDHNPRRFAFVDVWPWERETDKREFRFDNPSSALTPNEARDAELRELRIRELVKAGALIAAEIDRLQRVADRAP